MFVDGQAHWVGRFPRGGRSLTILFVLAVLFVAATSGLLSAPAQAEVEYSDSEEIFITLLNEYRVANGCPALLVSDTLSVAAQRHSLDMGNYAFFDHYTRGSSWFPWGYTPFQRMAWVGYDHDTYKGENIAAGMILMTGQEAFNAFKGSPSHNSVMLNPNYRVAGVGREYVPNSPYGFYWTVDFGGYIDPSAHWLGRNQQNDSRITYTGDWRTGWDGTYEYTTQAGAMAVVEFTGTSVELYAKQAPGWGEADIWLDGAKVGTASFHANWVKKNQLVYASGGLSDAPHTLLIICKTPGAAINIDNLKVEGSLTQAKKPNRYEQYKTELTYTGGWEQRYSTSASKQTYYFAASPGSSVNVKFDGTYISWVTKVAPNHGQALVVLDDNDPVLVDLYYSWTKYKQQVYVSGWLEDKEHTLSIYYLGEKNPASSRYYIVSDAFDIYGTIQQAPPAEPIPWTYQQNDSRITYLGDWKNSWDGTYKYTYQDGAAAVVNFTGTSVELYGRQAPGWGDAEIWLDGAVVDTVSFHADSVKKNQLLYASGDLSDEPHTLIIARTSPWGSINIDNLKVEGYLTQAEKPTRHEQYKTELAYTGGWEQRYSSSASKTTYYFAALPGASINVKFEGTYISWVTKVAPNHGQALVVLNDNDPVLVDLYYPWTKYKQQVYVSGFLEDKEHTLSIYYLGEKNPASSRYYIVSDAFDIYGTIQQASPAEPIAWTYQQDDPRIAYQGDWKNSWDGTYKYTYQDGAAAVVNFTGTSVELYGRQAPGWGDAEIKLDGVVVGTASFHADSVKKNQLLWASGGLNDEPHTLIITRTSPWGSINIDNLIIVGVLN